MVFDSGIDADSMMAVEMPRATPAPILLPPPYQDASAR